MIHASFSMTNSWCIRTTSPNDLKIWEELGGGAVEEQQQELSSSEENGDVKDQ
jgi:hypothetical protein